MVHETSRLLTEEQTRLALRLYYTGIENCAPGHAFGPAVRPHYLIHFVSSGRGKYLRREAEYELEAGEAFLILPGETTKYMADEKEPWTYLWVAFDGADAETLLARCGLSGENPVYHAADPENAGRLLRQAEIFEQSFRENGQNLLAVMGNFYLLFSHMVQEQHETLLAAAEGRSSLSNAETMQDLYFQQAAEYLKANFSYPVKVEQLAARIGISRAYLYKIFVSHCSMSIQEYLLKLRLSAAREMLRNTQRGITEIAYSCGFPDSPSFCRQFRREMQMTPLQYRKQPGWSLVE